MKLMEFLVVALAAGSVFASTTGVAHDCEEIEKPPKPVPSQAGEVDGKAVMCEWNEGQFQYSKEQKVEGLNLVAYVFEESLVYAHSIEISDQDRRVARSSPPYLDRYITSTTHIKWGDLSLSRRTLHIIAPSSEGLCELIQPDKIEAYYHPYIEYGNIRGETRRLREEERLRQIKKDNKI